MKNRTYNNMVEPERVLLVGVGINETITEDSLDELSKLCATCNLTEVGRTVQNRKALDMTWAIGKGKVEEIHAICQHLEVDCVVFDIELKGSVVRNLENDLGVAVLDRSQVILDIFAQRAQSVEGKLQVELAQLKYNLPRLVGRGGLLSKMRNAVGMRGPGEKKLELDKRTIRDEILELEKQIKKLSANRMLNKQQSKRSGITRVALAGYTNSGKSTLLNTLTKADVVAEDKLFATLDPKTASIYLQNDDGTGTKVLITDTVGFIDKLPHEFIHAFESTLDEVRYADVILHVVDLSNVEFKKQIEVVNSVIQKIGAGNIPQLLVFNKADKVAPEFAKHFVKDYKDSITISAKSKTGLNQLKEKLKQY